MRWSCAWITSLVLVSLCYSRTKPFLIGADISFVDQDETEGAKYYDNGVQKDIFQILKDHKFNAIRLRTFVNPSAVGGYSEKGYCDLAHTLKMAKRIYGAGMVFLLDFHYSDTWADPGKQIKPLAWSTVSFSALTDSVYAYTRNAIMKLKAQGTPPHMCQIGNEIIPGMLLPDGSTDNFTKLGTLLKAGIRGVKEVDSTIQVVAHLPRGNDFPATRWWLDSVTVHGAKFDILGESCYTEWHGQPSEWKAAFDSLARYYPKMKFMIAEYCQMKREANDVIFSLPNECGLGTFVWEPTRAGETIFTNSGNDYKTNSLIDLFPHMSRDYGNDTFTAALPTRAINHRPGYSFSLVAGKKPMVRYSVPRPCNLEIELMSVNGRIVDRCMVHATQSGSGFALSDNAGNLSGGAYIVKVRALPE